MKVSVLTASFNQGRFLDAALDSIAAQDYPVEHIVVDGGSTDSTPTVLSRRRGAVAHVISEADDGPADALNKALALATGDVFVCLNADDALVPGAVARAAAIFRRNENVDVVYAHGWIIDERGSLIRRFRSAPFTARSYALGAAPVMHQATFVRRTSALAIGGFNPHNRTCWDSELLLELALAGARFERIDEFWGLFRIHETSITGSQRLFAAYRRDKERLYERVMGRKPGPTEVVWRVVGRPRKWLRDPKALSWRIADAFWSPSCMDESHLSQGSFRTVVAGSRRCVFGSERRARRTTP